MAKSIGTEQNELPSRWVPTRSMAVRIALYYALLSVSWIFCSGWLLHRLVHSEVWQMWGENFKGWFFVLVTASLLGLVLDRTFRKIRYEMQKTQDSEAKLRLVGNNLPDGYMYQYGRGADGTRRFTYITAGVERVHGVSVAQVLSDANCLHRQIDPTQLTGLVAAEDASEANLTDFDMEVQMQRPDGNVRLLHLHSRPRHGTDGLVQWDGIALDITEQKRVEAALRDSENLLQSVMDLVPHFIFAKDRQGRYLFANRACAEANGMTPEQIIGLGDRDFIKDAAQAEAFIRDDNAVMESGKTKFISAETLTDAKGQLRILQTIKMPFTGPGGVPSVLGIAADITELKAAEAALRNSESKFATLFDKASLPATLSRLPDYVMMDVNDAWTQLLGFTKEELIGKTTVDLGINRDPQIRAQAISQLLEGKAIRDLEQTFYTKTGIPITVLTSVNLIKIGGETFALTSLQDITERKRMEEELRRSEHRLQIAMEAANMGAWEVNLTRNGIQVMWTDQYGALFGRKRGQFPTSAEAFLDCIHPEDRDPVRSSLAKALEQAASFEHEFRVFWSDGSIRWHAAMGRAVRNGETVRMVGVGMDITQRRELEAQLRQSQKLEGVGQLAGGVAHDFNNILAAIMMNLGLVQMNPNLDEDTRRSFKDLDSEVRRAASMTRQLLMFSRRSVLASRPLDLNEVVESLLKMLRRLIGENIELQLDGVTISPMVEADSGMMEQVLMNLVVNARDAMPKGGRITINISPVELNAAQAATNPDRRPGRYARLSVSDTGCGMDAATLKHIFEPFFTTKEAGKGTGLGLATVHGIVAQHKGWVEVDSEVGVGTTFRVYLPAANTPEAVPHHSLPAEPIQRGKETILLVEDEVTVRRLIAQALRALGYRVFEAGNGQEAMKLWQDRSSQVDLLFTDMVMPEGMTGLELTERLQALKPGLKAIISSGYSADLIQTGTANIAGIVYLPKPYETKVLASVVRECLDRKS